MASFKQHVNGAVIASSIPAIVLYSNGTLSSVAALSGIFFGFLGGIAPDVDSESSKPLQGVFSILSIVLPVLVLFGLGKKMSVLEMVFFLVVISTLLYVTLFRVFMAFTKHRGIFHSIPMGIALSLGLTLFLYKLFGMGYMMAVIYGFFFLFGFLTHLTLDEIFSINALGLRLKRSFGTAMKLYSKDNIVGTVAVYLAIAVFIYLLPPMQDVLKGLIYSLMSVRL